MDLTSEQKETATLRLLQRALGSTTLEHRWDYLSAAHIAGQTVMRLHCRTHLAMLNQALDESDWREACGQLLRLLLVPMGHALNRLPMGNTGRSRISAFAPMPVSAQHRLLIEQALASANHF
jgi:Protein of unknown function (DUF3703)